MQTEYDYFVAESGTFGEGVFDLPLEISGANSLGPNTLYYVRGFAQNSAGYSYGNQESFTTLSGFNPAIARRRLLLRR